MASSDYLAEELARCYDDPLRFVLWAFPWGELPEMKLVELPEPWASRYPGCKYGPDVWACEFLDEIGAQVKERKFDGRHAVDPIKMAVASGHGIGKALRCSEIVDTPSGPRRWGDIRVGDYLFGPDGEPTQVIAIPYRGRRKQYRMTFDDGSHVDCSGEHLWNVRGRQHRRKGIPGYATMTTEEIIARGVLRPNGVRMARQWEIPQQAPVEYAEAELPVEPYVMGLFLGDGGRRSGCITTIEPEVLDQLEALGYEYRLAGKQGTDAVSVTIYGLWHELRELGLLDCYSYEKYIPEVFKYASVEQRAELFRGLVDTDGEVTKDGSLLFSTTSPRLRDDFVWLARSLGGKARIAPTVKKPFYYDEDGNKVQGRDCYRVTATMPRGFTVGYVLHKAERIREEIEPRYLARWIDSIEELGEDECMCVTVDRDDGLFLGPNFTVTHNSCITAWIVCWIMATRPNCKGVVTANTASQLETKTWAEIKKWLNRSMVKDLFDLKATSIEAKESPESWRVDAITCREEQAESFAGQHAASSTSFYIFDEASAIPEVIYDVAEGGLTDGEPMMFLFGNPTRNSGRFFECFHKRKKFWNTRRIDSREVAISNKKIIRQWAEEYGEDSDFFKVRVKGEFPSQGSDQFIPADIVRVAMARGTPDVNKATCAIVGVDVARFGDDDTVIATRIGRDGTMPPKRYNGLNTVGVVARVKDHIQYLRRTLGIKRIYCFVDEGGVGGGPVDILKEDGFPVRGVNFSSSPDDAETYPYKREEMWGRMAKWLEDGAIANDKALEEDLISPTYSIDLKGRRKLESKKDMKKRGCASPDAADAYALTFAYRVDEYSEYGDHERAYKAAEARRSYNPSERWRPTYGRR